MAKEPVMTKLTAHHVYDDDDPSVPGRLIASIHPASKKIVKMVLKAKVNDHDGRSQFLWVRLPNGDLVLGVYPQAETYEACEKDAQFPTEV